MNAKINLDGFVSRYNAPGLSNNVNGPNIVIKRRLRILSIATGGKLCSG